MNGFYKVPDEKDSRVACFSCGVKYLCYRSGTGCTDEELLDQHEDDCHWADMYRELIGHAIITSPTSASDVAGQRHPKTESSPFPHRSSPLSSPLPAANIVSCETASDLSSPTSADNLRTGSDNTPPCQHPQSTSQNPISDQDISVPTVAHFVTEFSLSGLPAHSKFLLNVEGRQISAQFRCDYYINDEARLDEPQLKKRDVTSAAVFDF